MPNYYNDKIKDDSIFQRNRYKSRKVDGPHPYFELEDDYAGKAFYTKVISNKPEIDYKEIEIELSQTIDNKYPIKILRIDDSKKLASGLLGEVNAQTLADFKHSIFGCERDNIIEFLKYALEDVFFKKFSCGKLLLVRLDSTIYARSGFLRAGYSLANYPELVQEMGKNFNGFNTLNKWLLVENHEFFNCLLGILEFFFFPYILSFHAKCGIGTYFIFIPDSPIEYEIGRFPRDILDFIRSDSDLAKNIFTEELNKNSLYSKYCFETPPNQNDYTEFLRFFIDKVDGFIYESFNICNFLDETDKDKIDPIYALEYNISMLHILKMSLSIISSKDSYSNKSNTFQIADMFDALCNNPAIGIPNGDTELFKRLFNKNYFTSVLKPILEQSTINLKTQLANTMNGLYDELNIAVKNSVWLTHKINGNNITVKNRTMTSENQESIEDFTANVIRALRNSHHGYITRYDLSNRPSRYLSLITGELPGSFPSLTFYWILCLLIDKDKFIGKPS